MLEGEIFGREVLGETFDRGQSLQRWHGLVINKIVVFLRGVESERNGRT